ncbi:hypothetical protein ABPG75_002419 [Micractinium tetrahymenae]
MLHLLACLLLAAPSSATAAGPRPATTGRVLVQFRLQAAQLVAAAAATAGFAPAQLPGLSLQHWVGGAPAQAGTGTSGAVSGAAAAPPSTPSGAIGVFAITDGSSLQQKVAQLSRHPAMEVAEPELIRYALAEPNDPLFHAHSGQWHLHQVAAPAAWEITTGHKQVKVCVIDTGANAFHQDLRSNVVEVWNRDPGEWGPQPTRGTAAYRNVTDEDGHGTSCTGVIVAAGNNGVGITGVAWNASLHICKASSSGAFWTGALLDCYSLCMQAGVHVVSASFGSEGQSILEKRAIQALGAAGALVVSGSGNNGLEQEFFPAAYPLPNILAVGASDALDRLAPFSNFGSYVHLAAPGVGILSTAADANDAYSARSGTSKSCPIVAGAAALLFAAKPCATVSEVKKAIIGSVDKVPALKGKVSSGGRLNVARALATLLGRPTPTVPSLQFDYTWESGVTYLLNYESDSAKWSLINSSPDSCKATCQALSWCWYMVALGDGTSGPRDTVPPINCTRPPAPTNGTFVKVPSQPVPACARPSTPWTYLLNDPALHDFVGASASDRMLDLKLTSKGEPVLAFVGGAFQYTSGMYWTGDAVVFKFSNNRWSPPTKRPCYEVKRALDSADTPYLALLQNWQLGGDPMPVSKLTVLQLTTAGGKQQWSLVGKENFAAADMGASIAVHPTSRRPLVSFVVDSDPNDGYLSGPPWVLGWGGAAAGWRPLAGSGPMTKERARKCEMAIARRDGTVYLACNHEGTKLTVRKLAAGGKAWSIVSAANITSTPGLDLGDVDSPAGFDSFDNLRVATLSSGLPIISATKTPTGAVLHYDCARWRNVGRWGLAGPPNDPTRYVNADMDLAVGPDDSIYVVHVDGAELQRGTCLVFRNSNAGGTWVPIGPTGFTNLNVPKSDNEYMSAGGAGATQFGLAVSTNAIYAAHHDWSTPIHKVLCSHARCGLADQHAGVQPPELVAAGRSNLFEFSPEAHRAAD